mgnify:CR=1 FL=1
MNFPAIRYEDAEYFHRVSCPFAGVDSVTIDDKGRRHLFIHYWCSYHDEWIEGVGNLKGLFMQFLVPSMAYMDEEKQSVLQCMKYKDEVRFKIKERWYDCDKCFCMSQFIVEIQEEIAGDIRFYVPEICRKIVRVEVSQESLPCRIEVYDMSGMLVLTATVRECATTIRLDNLSSGTYIYRISRYGKAMQRGKIMIS